MIKITQTHMLLLDGSPHAVGTLEQLKSYCDLDTFDEYNEHGSDEPFGYWVQDWHDNDGELTRKYTEMDDTGPFHYAEIYSIISVGE